MGAASKSTRQRTCRDCSQAVYGSAADLKEHNRLCRMAARSGLTLPGVVGIDMATAAAIGRRARERSRQRPGMGGV